MSAYDITLAQVIHEKSNGNALYTKYLIDHAVINKTHTSFGWITALPPYEFNLTGYYQYLYEQIQGDTRVPFALCGANFSVTETELQEITHLGDFVSTQLGLLKPILRYKPSVGFSIYHESFKRFVIDTINSQGALVEHLIYRPLIAWLETHSFFESTKAYGHLLKLYYEVDEYDAITKTISVNFLDKSLYNAQPFHCILQNHNLQKAVLQNIDDFAPMIIIAEQMKIIYEIEHNITDQVLIKYLKAVQKIHGEEAMYRVLWDEEHLLIDTKDALLFLANQAYQGKEVVHWSIVPSLSIMPYDILGLIAVKFLHTKQYEKFESLIKNIYEDPKHKDALEGILDKVEWWRIHFGDEWIKNTPYFQSILTKLTPSVSTLEKAIKCIVENDNFDLDEKWKLMLRDIVLLTKKACKEEIESAINALSQYNWFRNWLIYLIKITDLSQREYSGEDIINAFSYLVRDLESFKGKPRACDLYKQIPFIRKSFHQGLLLCNADEALLNQCCELLEKVTNITTSLQRSFSGPLTDEAFLEVITYYLPGKYVIDKYEKYYKPLGSRRYYSDVAEIAFEYAHMLSCAGRDEDAKEKYLEGIQALTAYGFRKDRTFSEVLYCSVPYQETYGTLEVDWFYDLYHLAMGVVTHTDGKSTNSYPIEWFNEFIKAYPDEALRFLVSETIENNEAKWYEEDEFYNILEEYASLFNPTQWFLLCRSLPLASSNKILANGLAVIDQIDGKLQNAYRRWLKSIPLLLQTKEGAKYSQEIAAQFEEQFSIPIELKEENKSTEDSYINEASPPSSPFPTTSIDEALAFLETNMLTEDHATNLQQLFASITNWEKKKEILRQVAKSFRAGSEIGNWVEDLFESGSHEWLYLNVCLFVIVKDGWYHGLHYINYLKRAYDLNPVETIRMLKEIIGHSLSGGGYTGNISCNLIKGLSEIQLDEAKVKDLLQMTYQIIKRRLPHPPDSKINRSLYQGLEGFSRDEIVVALLIARLKTLTTEKTQGIIWSLTFIALSAPKTLLKPYIWAFTNHTFLLPIHRVVLLQILKTFVDKNLIPDELIGQLISNYPTGFFLEDQYIRSFIDYRIELDESSQKSIQLSAHNLDKGFFPYIHPKYSTLADYFGPLKGTYNAYAYQRDKISKEHERYYMRSEQIMTPIVSNANAAYKIVNSQFYRSLKKLTYSYGPSYTCNLEFCLAEIILQVGALTRRPSYLPTLENFPSFEVRKASTAINHEGWVTLALKEREIYGEDFKPKKSCNSSLVITCGEEPVKRGEFYAKYLFNFNQYAENNIKEAPFDQPICTISIVDSLEYSNLVYISPFIIRELDLKIDSNIHKGFQARNNNGEVIVKMLTWKENYYGSVSNGTEVPRIKGVAVMIREDYYERLLSLYSKDCWFVRKRLINPTYPPVSG